MKPVIKAHDFQYNQSRMSSISHNVFTGEETLLYAISQGQSSALETLYDRYSRLVYSLAVQITNDAALAEDITQDVFVQVWNKAATYHPEQGKVITWLVSIARHRAIDIIRQRGIRPEGHSVYWEEDGMIEPADPVQVDASVELDMQAQHVRRMISHLPSEQRQALYLAYYNGLSHQEIAEITHEPLGTIKTRIRLAMQKLRHLLEKDVE